MTPSQVEASQAFRKSPHRRGLPGARTVAWGSTYHRYVLLHGSIVLADEDDLFHCSADYCGCPDYSAACTTTPTATPEILDLNDPASVGCLAALAREINPGLLIWIVPRADGWYLECGRPYGTEPDPWGCPYPSEGEAWVAMILATPAPEPASNTSTAP